MKSDDGQHPGETASGREAAALERIEAFRRRRPRFRDDFITLAHGAGGKASAALIDAVFLDAFGGLDRPPLTDAALIPLPGGAALAFSTDSFVVKPLRFPGGSIGQLAVHGTVNDLAVMGARPQWLSAAFVIEEGFAINTLREVVSDMSHAAAAAGVAIVTGDTKVVGRGAADGVYVTTAGVGLVPPGRRLAAELVQRGDRVLISGTIADHGMAVMLARGDLALEGDLRSDTAPVTELVEALLAAAPSTRWMRDPTRGGVGTICNELAHDTGLAVVLDESALPIKPQVAGACDLLGIDPLYVANEGKLLAVVAPKEADDALAALRNHPLGADAALIGDIRAEPQGIVVLRTSFGGTRIVDMLVGDPLPRDLLSQVGDLRQLTERRRVRVTGTVQGVGFRPFVFREAVALGLVGFVLNDSDGVLVEIEGEPAKVSELCRLLAESPPPLARVTSVSWNVLAAPGSHEGFRIVESSSGAVPNAAVSVDSATCGDCLSEVDDPLDRRSGYPFTNCTNCGPRYTIVLSVPYDRPATTMAGFKMCPECQAEYDDPSDRRFHAQPNACAACGPRIAFYDPAGLRLAEGDAALEELARSLSSGAVAALKGIGGYQLAADATNEAAVAELRRRKARDDKPFALMVADLETARSICLLDGGAEAALLSLARPIVLAPRSASARIANAVAPGMADLGVMLPYTPLHHLLMAKVRRPLVMSSGNLSDDPIAHRDEDAFARLGPLVDGLLAHDRPIHVRCDDSVVRATGRRVQMVRRSRGYVPEALLLPTEGRRQVLAVGAELKNTVTVAKDRSLVCSHHIGDLEHLATYEAFLQATGHLCRLFGVEPDVVAHDLHPEYLSTKYALELDIEPWPVQHHHAHIASCMAEHSHTGTVLGVAFDGLGYGSDGTLWGGEFLVADFSGFERVGHLRPVAMPGGVAAIREPWRMALSWAAEALGPEAAARLGPDLDSRWNQVLSLALSAGTVRTSSVGRLFDAVAALVGLRRRVSYEGQAAIELEMLARQVPPESSPRYPATTGRLGATGPEVLDPSPLIEAVVSEIGAGQDRATVAAGFHTGLGMATAELAAKLARLHGLDTVALSGGVFQNVRFSDVVEDSLVANGLKVLVHQSVPANDGGISVGQAAIAALGTRAARRGTA